MYVFISFGSLHTGKNIGCCIVEVEALDDAAAKCDELKLTPEVCSQGRASVLPDEETFQEQGMDLNRFYTADEMIQMGFTKAK